MMQDSPTAEWRDPRFAELDAAITAESEAETAGKSARFLRRRPTKRRTPKALIESAALKLSKEIAHQCAETILRGYGHSLNRAELLQLARLFKSALVPKRRPGRKPSFRITRAVEDYKAGIRGVALWQTHIPRWHRLSRWRQRILKNNLMEAIRTRLRREWQASNQ
jgi:hypothetical protein